jgi:hypothetical protein
MDARTIKKMQGATEVIQGGIKWMQGQMKGFEKKHKRFNEPLKQRKNQLPKCIKLRKGCKIERKGMQGATEWMQVEVKG